MADAVNAYLYEHFGRRFAIAGHYIGNLERGQTRWPSAHYRTALRAVLDKATDAELGFFIIQGHADDPDVASAEPPPLLEPSPVAVSDVGPATLATVALPPAATLAGPNVGEPLAMTTETAMVQISVHGKAAATVVCHDAVPPGHVAIVAGRVRVLIDPADAVSAEVTSAVGDAPLVAGGARVYSIVQRGQSR
ncbi:hypothetical protein [Micromonospora sp. WMMD1082]|uniref:hypothetical protein n=1 Tax=Micromonospora sp. WMMD1082 TaxID=3016104 RepID=UPI0024159DFD|nr:hypothetical protein [Micromonospora sp. WMMD1082]MDG4797188.1 hypothetical protein [Micromonospora sp. WMMD1082]